MPKLNEDEWSKIINNISIISFLQGLNIGGKVYNGYSIINNTKNNEYVSEDSIYLADQADDGNYYEVTDKSLDNNKTYVGVLNTDFERRTYTDGNGLTKYFFPKKQLASYTSIVNQSNVDTIDNGNIYEYIQKKGGNIAKAYFTALGRERYGQYRTNNNYESAQYGKIKFSGGTKMELKASPDNNTDYWKTEAYLPAGSKITVKLKDYRWLHGGPTFIMETEDGVKEDMASKLTSTGTYTYETNKRSKITLTFTVEVSGRGMPNAYAYSDIEIESVVDTRTGVQYDIE